MVEKLGIEVKNYDRTKHGRFFNVNWILVLSTNKLADAMSGIHFMLYLMQIMFPQDVYTLVYVCREMNSVGVGTRRPIRSYRMGVSFREGLRHPDYQSWARVLCLAVIGWQVPYSNVMHLRDIIYTSTQECGNS